MSLSSKYIGRYTFLIGIISILLGFFIPPIPNGSLQPMGFISLILCPILGLVGSIFSIMKRDWIFLILNIILIPTFFIVMFIGYNL